MTGDLGTTAPKYQRIADELRREIKAGTPGPGDRLPAETALLARFRQQFPQLALLTLRQAMSVLRAEGLVESRHGVGTFVREDRRLQRRSRHRYGRARADQRLLTAHLDHQIIFAGREPVMDHVAQAAGVQPGTVMVVRRRLLSDRETGRPEELGASFLPVERVGGTLLEEPTVVAKALFLCVEELTGKRYFRVRDRWIARSATADEAERLRMPGMAVVIHLIHVASAEDGTLLEVSESVWPADRVEMIDEYPVSQEAEDVDGLSDI